MDPDSIDSTDPERPLSGVSAWDSLNDTGWIPLLLQVILVVQPIVLMLNTIYLKPMPTELQHLFEGFAGVSIMLAMLVGFVSPFLKSLTPRQRWMPTGMTAVFILIIYEFSLLMPNPKG
jgi:hypothetical protein